MCADWPQTAKIIEASSIKMIIIVSISLIVVSWRQTPFCPRCAITRVCMVILPLDPILQACGCGTHLLLHWFPSSLSPLHGVTEPVYVVVTFYAVYT